MNYVFDSSQLHKIGSTSTDEKKIWLSEDM